MKAYAYITACALLALSSCAAPERSAPKEIDCLQLITGFHSYFDETSGFEFRLFEHDGSATVAKDPIYLYLVATNNSSGEDLQSRVVELPQVSSIKKIRYFERPNIIQIDATFDRPNNNGSNYEEVRGIIEILIPIKKGNLPESISATVKIR